MLKVMVVAAALLVAAPAWGQGSTQLAAADVEKEVKRLFEEGQTAAAAQQWDKAKAAFVKAHELMPSPQILRHLARAEIRSGDLGSGIEHLHAFLKRKDEADNAEVEAVQALLAETKATIARVVLKVDEPGAEMLVDGDAREEKVLAQPIYLRPGAHTFEARKKGYHSAAQRFELSPDSDTVVSLHLVPLGDSRAERKTVAVESTVGGPTKWLVPTVAIGTGALAAAAIGSLVLSRIEHQRGIDVSNDVACTTDARCKSLYEDHRTNMLGFAGAFVGFAAGAGITGISTVIAWSLTRKSHSAPMKSGEAAFMVVPTLGGIRVQGAW